MPVIDLTVPGSVANLDEETAEQLRQMVVACAACGPTPETVCDSCRAADRLLAAYDDATVLQW